MDMAVSHGVALDSPSKPDMLLLRADSRVS